MLRRNLASVAVGRAVPVPGRRRRRRRSPRRPRAVCRGRSDAEASAILGVEQGGLAFWVAAVRECFEEAGVLLRRRTACPSSTIARPITAARSTAASAASSTSARPRGSQSPPTRSTTSVTGSRPWRAPPLRHPLLRRRAPPEPGPAARRRRGHRPPLGDAGSCARTPARGRLDMLPPTVENLKASAASTGWATSCGRGGERRRPGDPAAARDRRQPDGCPHPAAGRRRIRVSMLLRWRTVTPGRSSGSARWSGGSWRRTPTS